MFANINLTPLWIQAQKTSSADFATYPKQIPGKDQLNSNVTKSPTLFLIAKDPCKCSAIAGQVPNPLTTESLHTYPNAHLQVPHMKSPDFLLQCSEVHGSSSQQRKRCARLVHIAHTALYIAYFELWIVYCARNANCKVWGFSSSVSPPQPTSWQPVEAVSVRFLPHSWSRPTFGS